MKGLLLLSSSVLPLDIHCNPPCRKSRPKGHIHPHEPISFWTCTVYTGPREMWILQSLNTIHVIMSPSIQLPIFYAGYGNLSVWASRIRILKAQALRHVSQWYVSLTVRIPNLWRVRCSCKSRQINLHVCQGANFKEACIRSGLTLQIGRKKLTFAHPRG